MCLTNCTQLDITFFVNLLARYSYTPTWRHWNKVKHVLRYLHGTTGMVYFIRKDKNISYLDMQMLTIFQIPTKLNLKQVCI